MSLDLATFYTTIRKSTLFDGTLSKREVQGTDAIMAAWTTCGYTDDRWLAYALGTAYHETARAMYPVPEGGRGKGHPYGVPGKDGQVAYGRGFVQITWAENYAKADTALGLGGKLIANYELALDPTIAAQILFRGMGEAWFTKFRFSDYLNPKLSDYLHARRIVNGMDQAEKIAGYALIFHGAITAAERRAADTSSGVSAPAAVNPAPMPAAPYAPSPPVIAAATQSPAPPAAQDPLSTILAEVEAGLGSIIAPTASGPSPAPASVPSATNESAPMTDPATTAAPQSAASIPVLGTVLDFLRGVSGKLEAAHTMTTSGSNIATGVIASLPEIPTIVGEISTLVVDVETGAWGLVPTAVVAIVEEFEKIAGKFGLDMSKLDAFVRSLPFQPPVAKAA